MVAGDVEAALASLGAVLARIGVVDAVGQVLQRQEGVGRATLAQVDLDGMGVPVAVGSLHGQEVEGEAADDALAHEAVADSGRLTGFEAAVGRVGREDGPQVALAAWPTQHLVVGGEDFDLAQGRNAHLHAGALLDFALDHLLDDGPLRGDALQVGGVGQFRQLELHGPQVGGDGLRLGRIAGRGQVAQIDDGVAHAGDALVELGDDAA